jgi:hypothetical protein
VKRLIYLLKQYYDSNDYFKEWISREYKFKPLWKSYAEYFILISKKIKSDCSDCLEEKVKIIVKRVLEEKGYDENSFYIGKAKQGLKQVEKNDLFIKIDDGDPIDYCDLGINKQDNDAEPFFYLYVKNECIHLKEVIIEAIQNKLS